MIHHPQNYVTILCTIAESRCYSCNYAPSGYGYHRAGAPQCALQSEGHSSALDQWACKSGKCFVRLDKNGCKSLFHCKI